MNQITSMKQTIVCILYLAVSMIGYAQGSNDWQAFVGFGYRNFDDVQFGSFAFRNFNNVNLASGPFGMQDYSSLPGLGNGSEVTTDFVEYQGTDEGVDSSDFWGAIVGVEKHVHSTDTFEFSFTAGLQFYNLDKSLTQTPSNTSTGNFSANHFKYAVTNQELRAPPIDGPLAGLSPGATVSTTSEFEMDLFVVDFGIKSVFETEPLSAFFEAGPSLYFSDADSSQTQRGTWSPIFGTGDPGSYSLQSKRSDTGVTVGGYVAVGAGYEVNDQLELTCEYRYSLADKRAGTSQADINLDGHGGQLKFIRRF